MKYERLTKKAGWHKDIDLTQELGYSYIYQRLSELENKIENGTLIELPCKVGDTVFRIGKAINVEKQRYELYVQDYTIIKIEIYEEEILFVDDSDNEIYIVDFGETVFLTKAAAEKKLKELKGE